MIIPILSLALACLASCQQEVVKLEEASWGEVEKAWSGAAEISVYELKQERYGNIIDGEAVLIYVREPFLKDRQVKDESGSGEFQVLKLNATRDFKTGVYPYRTLMSVFHPLVDKADNKALKVTTSVQEWCGHVYMQANRRDGVTKTEVRSYFENEEGNSYEEKSSVLLEDEVWTMLRINPGQLPVGQTEMIQGSLASRFGHFKPIAAPVVTQWRAGGSKDSLVYEIFYKKSGRKLAIEISNGSPYSILGWSEEGEKGLLSSGKLKKRIENVDYWNYNDEKSGKKLRKKLGLE